MGHVSQRENFCLDLSTPLSLGLAEGDHVLTPIHFITGLLLYNRIKPSADLIMLSPQTFLSMSFKNHTDMHACGQCMINEGSCC